MIESELSSYKILDELGSGGMGKVYLAELTKSSAGLDQGQRVALKVVHPHLLEAEGFFKRFLREAQVGLRVKQENVVRTYECDAVVREGRQHNFLVMEYVEGQTLRDLLNELHVLPEELCRHIAQEMAKALAAIHEAGVIHRDLKPENVLITEDNVVKVMDLGVARLQDEIIRLSQTGSFVGSIHYAAPEQLKGDGHDVDTRSDLHALGSMLYELSTGKHPYYHTDMRVALQRVLKHEPRRVGEINPQLSPFFEEVLHKLLAKDPNDRFQSADELLEVLEHAEASAWWQKRAQALRIETRRPLRRVRVPRETALFGRDEELARLHELYDKAKAGAGQVVLVEGEAGIGRTRLVDEFVSRLHQEEEDINFLFGEYPAGGAATAAGSFAKAYREQFGLEDLEQTLETYLAESPALIPAFAALLRGHPTPKGSPPLTQDSMQTVFVHATRALASERTTIVLIDDLHFAPEAGLALFASLARAAPDHRVLLIGTTRPGLPEDWAPNLEREHHVTRLPLARLDAEAVRQLVLELFRSESLAEELSFQIVMQSDGNPYFVFEIIRGLRESGHIAQHEDGNWISTQAIGNVQIPSSVMDLVEARITDLTDEERETLEVAACSGFTFDPALVAEAVGQDIIATLKCFARIEKAHRLIRSEGRRYQFDHHQVQESLYAGLFPQLREEYHAALAEAIEKQTQAAAMNAEELPGDLAVELCNQWSKAGRHADALRYLDAALDYLESGFVNDAVIELTDRALGAGDLLEGTDRVRVLVRRAGCLHRLGRREEEQEALDEAVAIADAADDKGLMASARFQLGAHLNDLAKYGEARAEFVRASELAEAAEDAKLQAAAVRGIGNTLYYEGRAQEAMARWEASLELARAAGDPVGHAGATVNLGNAYGDQGDLEKSAEWYRKGVALADEAGRSDIAAIGRSNLVSRLHENGLLTEALEESQNALRDARETGDRIIQCSCQSAQVQILHTLGDTEAAASAIDTVERIAREVQNPRQLAIALGWRATLERDAGKMEAARGHASQALVADRETGTLNIDGRLLGLGAIELDLGEHNAARAHLEEAFEFANQQDAASGQAEASAQLALLPGGDPSIAWEVFTQLESRLSPSSRMHVHFLLYQGGGGREHLEAAHELLCFARDHAPEAYRESMIENVRLHRDIMKAWKSSDEGEDEA